MDWFYSKAPYTILPLLAFWVLVFSLFDVVFNKGWQLVLILLYVLLIILFIVLLLLKANQKLKTYISIEAFEKTLKGGLYHFKCPKCSGIFAVKKTRKNDKKPVKITCPDCGQIGVIPVHPLCIEEDIPEKKSVKANFRCDSCGEGVTIWAEGADLYDNTSVLSCPFCGIEKPLQRF